MKKPANVKKSYRRQLLAASIAALTTAMLVTSVSNASDIEIYQEAKSGTVTLMMVLDISGSMGYPQITSNNTACDIPTGATRTGYSNENSTNGSPTYKRHYCLATGASRIYQLRSYKVKKTDYYQKCNNPQTNYTLCDWGTETTKRPPEADTYTMESDGTYTYYYTSEAEKFYDRITRLKDGMFDLLHGNASKGIAKLSDERVIGLSTFSHPTSLNSAGEPTAADNVSSEIRVPARRLDAVVNGVTQRQILLNTVANLGARGGTPTANAYAEAVAYLMGNSTYSIDRVNVNTYFRYYPEISKNYLYRLKGNKTSNYQYFQCNNNVTSAEISLCSNSITKAVFENAVTGLPSESSGSGKSKETYYYQPMFATNPQYKRCLSYNTNGCTSWSSDQTTNPTTMDYDNNCTVGNNDTQGRCVTEKKEIFASNTASGFEYSAADTKSGLRYIQPSSLVQTTETAQCSGQGVYVLTDGDPNNNGSAEALMKAALGTKGSSFSCSNSDTGWNCINNLSSTILDPSKNSAGLVFKTAVVGFGGDFNSVPSFDKNLTEAQNLANISNSQASQNQKNAASWGVKGQGGWYSGNNSQDIVDSVNNFINDLSTTIPSVTTGSPTIPKDALNPAMLQDDAYYQQFSPTPDKSYQLWVGNLKKYFVDTNGILKDKDGNKIVDSDGKLLDNYDYWAATVENAQKDADENTVGSTKFALRGGAWSRVLLRTNPASDPQSGTIQRKVLTNRDVNSSNQVFESTSLRQVKPTDLTDNKYKNDPYRGYLVRLLGYNIDAANPPTDLNELKTKDEFRQMGAVMHSYPVLLTNKGKLSFNTTTKSMETTNREDYVLFGTTQGILHVVKAGETGKAGGGEEVFSFVPDEMVIMQRQAFEKPETTNGGINHLYYGIDGPWTAYTEYVVDSSGNLTVGNGKGNQKGVQDVYGGLRMGGKSYYALDLANINDPKLKFHIDPEGTCSDSNPLGCMGQSWSKPSIGFVNWKGKRTRVMFVGGGYDTGYEDTAYEQTNKIGAGVYMFDANDGSLLWWGSANATTSSATANSGVIGTKNDDMKYSVVSEIRTVDRDGDDLIDHIYFGDLGGQVFRVDFDNSQNVLGKWAKTPVRLFNGHLGSGKSPRFYDMPAFSLYSSSGNIFAVISQGSGNRSKPLFADSTYNYDAIYNIYDKDVARKDLYSATTWNTKDIKPDNSLGLRLITDADRKNDATIKAPYSTNGWYYQYDGCVQDAGNCNTYTKQTEKVFGTPVALNKKLFVSTFDASKDGLAGDCGAGVKGASLMTTFCLPYGQCKVGDPTGNPRTKDDSIIGAGIHTIAVGNDKTGGGNDNGNNNNDDNKDTSSASNYCIATGGRMTITVTGGNGTGDQTRMCLIPQRWYPKLY